MVKNNRVLACTSKKQTQYRRRCKRVAAVTDVFEQKEKQGSFDGAWRRVGGNLNKIQLQVNLNSKMDFLNGKKMRRQNGKKDSKMEKCESMHLP